MILTKKEKKKRKTGNTTRINFLYVLWFPAELNGERLCACPLVPSHALSHVPYIAHRVTSCQVSIPVSYGTLDLRFRVDTIITIDLSAYQLGRLAYCLPCPLYCWSARLQGHLEINFIRKAKGTKGHHNRCSGEGTRLLTSRRVD